LENLAYSYINLDKYKFQLISYLCIVVGGLIFYFTSKSRGTMTRSMYLFYTGVLILASPLKGIIWLIAPEAIVADVLFVVVFIELASFVLIGYVFGIISARRSMDAFNSTANWWMGFTPFVNMILLFKPSAHHISTEKWKAPVLVASFFIMVGIAQALWVGLETAVEKNTKAASSENPIVAEKLYKAALHYGRLEDILSLAVSDISVPDRIDERITLSNVSAKGKELRFRYTLAGKFSSVPDNFATHVRRTFCLEATKDFITLGATVTAEFQNEGGTPIGIVNADSRVCDSL
jgi:hypothetical protein